MKPSTNRADLVGIINTSLCMVHCLLTPILLAFLGSAEWLHDLSYLFLFLSFYAIWEATQHSTNSKVLSIIWLSFALLSVSILFEEDFKWLHYLNYVASIGIIGGHILNIRYCKQCNPNQQDEN